MSGKICIMLSSIAVAVIEVVLFSSYSLCEEIPELIAPVTARVLTANVGNADIMNCGTGYYYKLCLVKYENILTENIAKISPDIVALQEVLASEWCDKMPQEKKKIKVCYRYKDREVYQQARRLLGDDYTIVCDGRSNFECVGIKKDFGKVTGCEPGELCMNGTGLTHDVPEGCDEKAAIFGVDVEIAGKKMRIVNGHPTASDEVCRADEVTRMFEGYGDVPPLSDISLPVVAMGDMNLDPYFDNQDSPDIIAWTKHVGEGQSFYYLSGIAETQPPFITASAGKILDHVISNFATGKCQTLGEAKGTERLDGVEREKYVPEANDHRAILCELEFPLDSLWNKND